MTGVWASRVYFVAVCVSLFICLACTSGDNGDEHTPTVAPSPGEELAELTKAVAEAIEGADSTRVLELLDLPRMVCVQTATPGAPLCPAGMPSGTQVEVLPYSSGCSLNYVPADPAQLRSLFEELFEMGGEWRHYATGLTGGQWHGLKGIEAVVILESPARPQLDLQLGVTGSGIRSLARGCGGTPDTDAAQFEEFLVPPSED